MSYVLFFKTPEQEKSRYYHTKIFDTVEEAIQERDILLRYGFRGEDVIYTSVKEGQK
jgi:hypothetical protein